MVRNPKALGSQWERDFAKQLSLWWTIGTDENVFWRTDSSGSRGTLHTDLDTQKGDITFKKDVGKPLIDAFIFELKRYSELDLMCLLKDQRRVPWEWWERLVKESQKCDHLRVPFLIIKIVPFKAKGRGVFGFLPSFWSSYLTVEGVSNFRYKNCCIFDLKSFMSKDRILFKIKYDCGTLADSVNKQEYLEALNELVENPIEFQPVCVKDVNEETI